MAPEADTSERKMDSNCLISLVNCCIVEAHQFVAFRNTVRPFPVMGAVAKTST
jgi:hypothetical protein